MNTQKITNANAPKSASEAYNDVLNMIRNEQRKLESEMLATCDEMLATLAEMKAEAEKAEKATVQP